MKILFYLPQFPVLSETFILHQVTGLLDRGHDIQIITNRRGGPATRHAEFDEYGLQTRTRLLADAAGDIHDFDVVHCHFGPAGIIGSALREGHFFRGKLITSFYGYDISGYPREHGKDVYRELFRRGDRFVVTTDAMWNETRALGCPEEKTVKHYPSGIDLAKFVFHPRAVQPGDPIILLTVARLVEKKGIAYALHAVAKAKQHYPNLRYWIVGDGPLHDSLQSLVAELDLTETVQMLGAKTETEVLQLLSQAHLFLLPSVTASDGNTDPSPIALLEAQAAGLPVLSTYHSGIPEIVIDGESGWLVPERDVVALTDKLYDLLAQPYTWTEIGHKGRQFVETNYDANDRGDRLVAIYEELLANN